MKACGGSDMCDVCEKEHIKQFHEKFDLDKQKNKEELNG